MNALRAAVFALAALAVAAIPAGAVEQKAKGRKAPEKPAAAAKEPAPAEQPAAPPYETQVMRLSEIMGALAYLRDLCGDGDGREYRARMSALLDAEATAPERRDRYAGAYNRGYTGYEATYSRCTPNARAAIDHFIEEGGRLARDVSARFGGS